MHDGYARHNERQEAPADTGSGGRIVGIDVARALAAVGMFAVHTGPNYDSSLAGRLYALPHGRASILFVLVAGVGVTLLATSRRATLNDTRLWLAWAGAVLLLLGLALQTLDHNILVVLQTYAALFLVAIVAISLPDRWLLALDIGKSSRWSGPQAVGRDWDSVSAPDLRHRGCRLHVRQRA